jgi:TolB-like protein/DNA-binding winged helix-turn-helix (wHTH) protein/lipopolysaccharide biosynthesis regulator YciM
MKATDSPAIRIGAWRVDPALDEISKDGNSVKLERRAMQLLVFLSKHADQVVSVEQLLDEVWAGVVVTQDSVYQAVAALRRELGDDSRDPTYIATVPRRGYRLIAPVAPWVDVPHVPSGSLPRPALEPAPASLVVTKAGLSWRHIGIVVCVAFALAVGYVIVNRSWLPTRAITAERPPTGISTVTDDKSIAVLPFVDMSEKKDQEYFADGMAEEVLDLLAKVPGMRVIGRTSSFQFKGKNEDLRTIGGALGAAYVVEGTVRRSGQRLRVTAQLISTQNGSHLWSETYDEGVGDVLEVQDRIAAGLVRALQVSVGADYLQSQLPIKNGEAYDLYLRGRYAFDRFDKAGFESAASYFQQAVQLDPSFTRAAEWLANAQESLPEMGFVPVREGYERARASIERGLALNPKSGQLHALMGDIHAIYDWDWSAAEEEAGRALAFAPRDALVLEYVGQIYLGLGRWDDAARVFESALSLDPLMAAAHVMLANVRDRTGRIKEAEAETRRALEISPTFSSAHLGLGEILLEEGRFKEALGEMQQEPIYSNLGIALVYHAMGRNAESAAALAEYTKEHAQDDAYEIACAHAYRGEADAALEWLDRAYRQKDAGLYMIKGDWLIKNLEGDPRYKAFLRKMKLAPGSP